MEIIHALRGLGLGSPRTGKGLELDGSRGEVIRPMDKSRKPPRAPNGGHKRARMGKGKRNRSSRRHYQCLS